MLTVKGKNLARGRIIRFCMAKLKHYAPWVTKEEFLAADDRALLSLAHRLYGDIWKHIKFDEIKEQAMCLHQSRYQITSQEESAEALAFRTLL